MNANHTPYTNSCALLSSSKATIEAFHKRLQRLYPCVEDVMKLPQAWSPESKAQTLGLVYDNLGCYIKGNGRREEEEKFAAAVRTDHYIPPSCLIYYFEIKIISKGREGFMGVGLTSAQVPLTKFPGWVRESYGYHADDGNAFSGDGRGQQYGPSFTTGDVIGCGYNLVEGYCFFTKNGLSLGKAFDEIPSNILLYPTIGLKTAGEEIKANFGQDDFVYDIEQDHRDLRLNMTRTIRDYPISDFGSWQNTLHKLVQSWLLQNSYADTADAFTRSAKIECNLNLQRIQQRNRIQQLVLNGRISEAIRLTNRLCPDLLQNNPNLLFALKCRQFVELISGAENDYQPIFNYSNLDNSSANGLQRMEANGDQPESPSYLTRNSSSTNNNINNNNSNNGCNGMTGSNNGALIDNQQSASSSSLQELMDIDQPLTSLSNAIDSNHRSSSTTNNDNHLSLHQDKIDMNGSIRVNNQQTAGNELDENEQKLARLLQFGRELSDYLQQLDKLYGKNEINEKMLQDTIGLIAFTNPKNSCFGKLLDPSEREPISQLLNSSILKAEMGDSYRPPLEEVMNHLRKLIRLNDSQGRWIVEKFY